MYTPAYLLIYPSCFKLFITATSILCLSYYLSPLTLRYLNHQPISIYLYSPFLLSCPFIFLSPVLLYHPGVHYRRPAGRRLPRKRCFSRDIYAFFAGGLLRYSFGANAREEGEGSFLWNHWFTTSRHRARLKIGFICFARLSLSRVAASSTECDSPASRTREPPVRPFSLWSPPLATVW